jgi:hypothetical protein
MILQQNENHFERAVHKAKLSDLERQSPVNGLSLIHFAVTWPFGLRTLIQKGVNINPEDHRHQRPIHLAVTIGSFESVEHLVNADCALSTTVSDKSLLELAMLLKPVCLKQSIVCVLMSAFANRHMRLLDMAMDLLPRSVLSKVDMNTSHVSERIAPNLIELLESRGMCVPEALELDGRSFYEQSWFKWPKPDNLTPDIADVIWDAGFKDINTPDQSGIVPLLKSCAKHNFGMVAWFAEKGVPLSSHHRDAPLTALHIYALGFALAEDRPANEQYMAHIQEELGIPYDTCTCLCSPNGCSPVKFLERRFSWECNDGIRPEKILQQWFGVLKPKMETVQQYIYELSRLVLFSFIGGQHTCCILKQDGAGMYREECVKPLGSSRKPKERVQNTGQSDHQNPREYRIYGSNCNLHWEGTMPFPQDDQSLQIVLDSLMAHFDKMPRPDSMPAEDQPFEYLNWLIVEGHLLEDEDPRCPWCIDDDF